MPSKLDKVILASAAFCLYAMNGGFTYVFGIFLPELVEGLDCSKVDVSIASAIQIALCLGCGVMAGGLVELLDCHVVSIIGSVITVIGIILNAFVQHVTHFYITHGVITGFGMGLQFVPIPIVIQRTFSPSNRAAVMGFVVCGNGFGIFIGAPLVQICMSAYGWRGTYLLIAAGMLNGIAFGMTFRTKFKRKLTSEPAEPPTEPPEENTLNFCIGGKIPLTPLLSRSKSSHENAADSAKLLTSPSQLLHQKWITAIESGSENQTRVRTHTLGGDHFRSNVELYLSGMGSVDNMRAKPKKYNIFRHVIPNDYWFLNRKYNSEMCIKHMGSGPSEIRFSSKKNSLVPHDAKTSSIQPEKGVVSSYSSTDFHHPSHIYSSSTIKTTPLQSVVDISTIAEVVPTIREFVPAEGTDVVPTATKAGCTTGSAVLFQSDDAVIVANGNACSHADEAVMNTSLISQSDSGITTGGDLTTSHSKSDAICNGHMTPLTNGDLSNHHVINHTDSTAILNGHVTPQLYVDVTGGSYIKPCGSIDVTSNGQLVPHSNGDVISNGHVTTPSDENVETTLLNHKSNQRSFHERMLYYLRTLFDISVITNVKYMLLVSADFATTLALFVPITFMVYKAQIRGIDPIRASVLVSVYGISDMFGRFLGGLADMKFCPVLVMSVTDITASLLAAVSGSFDTFPWMIFFSVSFGLASGGHVTTSALLSGEVFEVERIHKALGLQYTTVAISISISYPISAAIWEATGDVETPFYYVAAACALGSLITFSWYIYYEILLPRRAARAAINATPISDTVVL